MRSERTPHARRYWAALVFLLLGVLAGVWHNRRIDHGRPDYLVGATRGVVAPPAGALGRISHWFGAQFAWITHGRSLETENTQLKARVAELEGENAGLREAQINYDRLR